MQHNKIYRAERLKSIKLNRKNSYKYEYTKIQKYIQEYAAQIKYIKNLLIDDPDNEELLLLLKDKEHRKELFEDDIKIIEFDENGNRIN